ncbi:hypothetical protein ALHIDCOG_00038 [Klebsiella phage CPRSB]|nr:hypothetical protein ALHIDCOG_00038 [Klebsiella phage CPRSB]
MTFSSLRSWEARYFVEVGAAPAKKKKANPKKANVTAPVAPVAPATADLDQMLDGGSAMSVELDPLNLLKAVRMFWLNRSNLKIVVALTTGSNHIPMNTVMVYTPFTIRLRSVIIN